MFKINISYHISKISISSSIVKGVFESRAEHHYNLRCISQFFAPLVSTVFHSTECISFLGPKICILLPESFKIIDSLENFQILIKKWKPENYPCRLCRVYTKNVGFLSNKKLCIISQDNILIIKFSIFRFRFFTFAFGLKFNISTALWWQGVLCIQTIVLQLWFCLACMTFCYQKTLQVNF